MKPVVIVYRRALLPWSETFVRDQVRALRHWRPVLTGEERVPNGLPLDDIDTSLLPTPTGLWQRLFFRICRRLWLPYPPYVAALRRMDAKLVHAHFGPSAVDIAQAARAAGLPLLVTLHGYDINVRREWWEQGRGGTAFRHYPTRLLKLATWPSVYFLAVSEAVKRRAIEYGIPPDRIIVSCIGVDCELFSPSGLPLAKRRRRILYVGRMVEKKSPLLIVHAFSRVRARVPDAELVMVGDGPLRGAAERLANELEVPVIFTGACSSTEVLGHLHQAMVFCLPSQIAGNGDAEGLPISILEAQACGVPVVTTRHSGNPEGVIDGVTGALVAEADVEGLAQALQYWLSQAEKFSGPCDSAVQFVRENFEISRCTSKLEAIYGQFCNQ